MSKLMRISRDVHEQAQKHAALRGLTVAEMLALAWEGYMDRNRERIAAELEEHARQIRGLPEQEEANG